MTKIELRAFRIVTVLGVLFVMVGCATKYLPPDNEPRATLQMSVDFGDRDIGLIYVQAFNNDKCAKTPYGNRLAWFNASGTSGPHKNVRIPMVAEREFILTFGYRLSVPSLSSPIECTVTSAFTPRAGKTYAADFTIADRRCTTQIMEVTDTGDRSPVVDVRQVTPPCFNNIDG